MDAGNIDLYKQIREKQASLKRNNLTLEEFDILVELYFDDLVKYEDLREKLIKENKIRKTYFSDVVIGLENKDYIESKKRDSNRKDIKITSEGRNLIEKVLGVL